MTAPMTYSLPEAAERLGQSFTFDWLKSNLTNLPHGKTGNGRGRSGRVFFTEAHLAEIVERYTIRPADEPAPTSGDFSSIVSRRSA